MPEVDEEISKGSGSAGLIARSAMQTAGGAVPFVGGMLSAIAGAWSEKEQAKVNQFFDHWVRMLREELSEKEATVIEIMARLDLTDERIAARVESKEFQSLIKKTFREWSGAESEDKRVLIRNVLTNAAASSLTSDDVVRMFIDWIGDYSELHFKVVGAIYNSNGISRGAVWQKIGKGRMREDSADADLYKLLFRDLSTGGVIRQHRESDQFGNFISQRAEKRSTPGIPKVLTSAFDQEELYDLTKLGAQFVHYAMNSLAPRIDFNFSSEKDNLI